MSSFAQLGVKPWLQTALKSLGITKPTPVQTACVPPILSRRNVIASAETGTGKTAAFLLPILQTLSQDPYGIFAVILTPTRELALQISQQVAALGARLAVRHYVLVGGVDELAQAIALKKRPHIVVATPGRLALMLQRRAVDLSRVRFLVLDEADRLLHPTYVDELSTTLDACSSPARQTLMFSATMTPSMELLHDSLTAQLSPNGDDAPSHGDAFRFDARDNQFGLVEALDQRYIFTPPNLKDCHLVHLLKQRYPTASAIIFVSRCATAALLLSLLNLLGMRKVAAMHSDMRQTARIESLQKFKSRTVRALIATDVASRGLDIPACDLVINYDVPRCVATYVHRVGRTARAGRSGCAINLVTQSDVTLLHAIEEKVGRKVVKVNDLKDEEVLDHLSASLKARQMANLTLHENGFMERNKAKRAESRKAGVKRKRMQRAKSIGDVSESEGKRVRASPPPVTDD